jgi:hypothetical protein
MAAYGRLSSAKRISLGSVFGSTVASPFPEVGILRDCGIGNFHKNYNLFSHPRRNHLKETCLSGRELPGIA